MKRTWQVACILFLAGAVVMLISSFEYPYKDRLGPGPGFFPFWLSLIVVGLSIALLFQITRGQKAPYGSESPYPNRQGAGRILIVLVALVGSLAMLDYLGFRISLLLFLLFLPIALGIRQWWVVSLFALAGSFGIFHVFYHWLKVPLPMGFFGL